MNMDKNNELNTGSIETNNVVIPVDSNAYAQVGTTLNQSSTINNSIVEQLNNDASYDNGMDNYTSEQTNLNKSINNYTDVVGKYNRVSNEVIDNGEGVSSFEDQLNNSQDLVVYTQQPKKATEMPNMNNGNYPMEQQYNYGNNDYNTNGMNYSNNPSMSNDGYPNNYNNGYANMGYNDYQNMNYNNGYNDNYNMDYNNNVYNDNYNNNMNYDNYNNGYNNNMNNYNNPYDNNMGYNDYQPMNYNNGYNDNYNMGYNNNPGSNGYLDTSYNTNNISSTNFNNNNNDDIDTTGNSNSIKTKHRKTIGPDGFDKKMKKNLRPFNFMLVIIYVLIIGIIGYFGYQYWLTRNDFYFVKDKMNLAEGSSFQEKIYVKGKLENNKDYEWKSDNDGIITVDSDGKIVGKAEGTANIKVTSKKTKTTKTIIVKVIDVDVKQLTTKDKEKVVYIGNSYTIVPLINGQSSLTIDLKWENSNDNVATVDEDGVVTPKKTGSTTVTISIPNTEFKTSIIIIVAEKK